jgi:monoamine oxidase
MSHFDVIVVGAGAAGLAAARRLQAAGRSCVVLEARPRPGGRAITDHSLDAPADLGAAWLHFGDQSEWTRIAERAGCTVIRREPGWGPNAWIGSRPPTEAEKSKAAADYQRYHALIEAAADAGRDVSLDEVLPRDDYRPRFDAVMTWAVGAESRDVSTLDLARYEDSRHNWAVREGLGTVVAHAADGLDVRLRTQVRQIDWSGRGARVISDSGTLEADAVIVTVPTTVLARGSIQFTPALPAQWRDAAENLPLGVANKVFFVLPPDCCDPDTPRHFIGRTDTSRTCSYVLFPGEQRLLCAYFGGDLSIELESRGELEAYARDDLRKIFGARLADGLGAARATAWGKDPCALGSYSAARPGHAEARNLLSQPVAPQLLFAGEACSVNHYGTLHGAWLSGVAAASRLLPGQGAF